MLSTNPLLSEAVQRALQEMLTMTKSPSGAQHKPFRRCQVWIIRLLICGTWYTGSSITNGEASTRIVGVLNIQAGEDGHHNA